jgi:hypothetical protein
MNYREALEIARCNPGFSVSPTEAGGFAVHRADGTPVNSAPQPEDELSRLKRDKVSLEERLAWSSAQLDQANSSHRAALASLESKSQRVSSELAAARTENALALASRDKQVSDITKHLQQLQSRLAKVSKEELDRITAIDAGERDERSKERKAQRRVQNCSCRGEVESCVRCGGRGYYATDGYGNSA